MPARLPSCVRSRVASLALSLLLLFQRQPPLPALSTWIMQIMWYPCLCEHDQLLTQNARTGPFTAPVSALLSAQTTLADSSSHAYDCCSYGPTASAFISVNICREPIQKKDGRTHPVCPLSKTPSPPRELVASVTDTASRCSTCICMLSEQTTERCASSTGPLHPNQLDRCDRTGRTG